jgi:DNA segregation ATPase FtsK/SpoIIIE, S-DNA-T family
MRRSELIGQVAAAYLRDQIPDEDTDGTARFILDCLNAEQTAAVAFAILADSNLSSKVDVKIPANFVADFNLPDIVLTNERATNLRHAPCSRQALLIANTGNDEEQSLRELVSIGTQQLLNIANLWVQVAARQLPLTEEHTRWWTAALRGLQDVPFYSLDQFAEYVLQTYIAVKDDGEPIILALGKALPALEIPRHTTYFNAIREKERGWKSSWRKLYEQAYKKYACYLRKQNPSHVLISDTELTQAFEKACEADAILQIHHLTIQVFIESPSGWNEAAMDLARCEWEEIKPLFDGLKPEKLSLGQATYNFYKDRESELLTDDEWDYLGRLKNRRTTDHDEEDRQFFEQHRHELREDRKMKSMWDKFVFGKPIEVEDFLVGIALCLEPLFDRQEKTKKGFLHIRCDRGRSKKMLRELNIEAGLYFAWHYRGLQELFGQLITWDVGDLFKFDQMVAKWKAESATTKKPLNTSTARDALQLKFEITLDAGITTQLIWRFRTDPVTSKFQDDWERLTKHPLVFCSVNRNTTGNKGQNEVISLSDVKTFQPAYSRDRGSFVAKYRSSHDIGITWQQNFQKVKEQGFITENVGERIRELYSVFEKHYTSAIIGFAEVGLIHQELGTQLTAYMALLNALLHKAKGDGNRMLLLKPLLQIGVVAIEDSPTTAIVAPWHPLRLAAMVTKARWVFRLLKQLLTSDTVEFGDTRLLFKNIQEELAHPFYPELVLGWDEQKPELLSLSDTVGNYSLHEKATMTTPELDDTQENPTEAANRVLEIVKRYLALHPHEQTNLSLVLYNCDSARLPQAVVDKLGSMHEDDDDVRCQVILRHRNSRRLHMLYERINEATDTNADAFNASEITQDFMARLRISIEADQAPSQDPKNGCPNDLVFSQDVIARHARIEWYPVAAKPLALVDLIPPRWSRRRPAASDDMKSIVYLCCPVQSKESWAYLTALTTFFKGDWDGNDNMRLIPARQLDFQHTTTAAIFRETHNLGNWVVNYDELLDRRQLLNQDVRVIRYKQSATQGRNVIISSTAPLGLLRSMVHTRLRDLNLSLNDETYSQLTDQFISDANTISGDIVLRAARRGRSASELMGIVLSRFLVRHELGHGRYEGWYFLDDYAEWLGQREDQIADILLLSPEQTDDAQLRLSIIVTEAKYIESSNLGAKRKESQKQLRDTIRRFRDAFFVNRERLDRELWLSRLSDLLLDGIQFPANAPIDLAQWQRAIREGNCEIYLRGYSHVFVPGPDDVEPELVTVANTTDCYQEIFGRTQIRDLVLRYLRDQIPGAIREAATEDTTWLKPEYAQAISTGTGETSDQFPVALPPPEKTMPGDTSQKDGNGPSHSSNVTPFPEHEYSETNTTSPWAYPQIVRLITSAGNTNDASSDATEWLKQVVQQTKGALQQFQLRSKLVSSTLTPNAALLKFEGSAQLTVDQVMKRRSEFLTTFRLNLVSVQPEPGIVSLAIARPTRQLVLLQDLWKRWPGHPSAGGNRDILIGVQEANGDMLFLSPGKRHAPHTLIAGTTGSGKSVLMQNIILGVAATNTPAEARIILIDPKQGVDYFQFDTLPHLEEGVIDQQEQAIEKLQGLVTEMDERYRRFKQARASNIAMYNQRVPPSEQMAAIWLVHDEFAEWMLVEDYKQEVTATVGRLGVKARAAGISLVFAAQRPDANVIPMQLRANLGNRLILRVDSEGTSEIALGEKGAERLLGRGHLLAKLEGENEHFYAQVPFVDEEWMEQIVATIRGEGECSERNLRDG